MAPRTRIAIAGAGNMARARGRAFLDTGRAVICAVASKHVVTARQCATELNCDTFHDDYRRLGESSPDAVLIEVPHKPQDEIAAWALRSGHDLLIGGALASSIRAGQVIVEESARQELIVEAGFQRRYGPCWVEARRMVREGTLGEPIMAVSSALWDPDPDSWYYDQQASGGMPLTHLSYVYMNAVRWIMGTPTTVFAIANRKLETQPGRVTEETCGVLVEFENGSFASATASYTGPKGMSDPGPRVLCANGGIEFNPEDASGRASFTVFRDGGSEVRSFDAVPSDMVRQAHRFLDALDTRRPALNPPEDALVDIRIAEAISISAREQRAVSLRGM